MLTLPRLGTSLGAIVDSGGVASNVFARFWDQAMSAIEGALTSLQDQEDTQAAQEQQLQQQQAELQKAIAAISSPAGLTISSSATSTATAISMSAHQRLYLDKARVNVNTGEIDNVPYATSAFVYYDDPNRAGGAVNYQYTTDPSQAVASFENINRHYVGAVMTPSGSTSQPTSGGGATAPGQSYRPGSGATP